MVPISLCCVSFCFRFVSVFVLVLFAYMPIIICLLLTCLLTITYLLVATKLVLGLCRPLVLIFDVLDELIITVIDELND